MENSRLDRDDEVKDDDYEIERDLYNHENDSEEEFTGERGN